MKLKKKQPYQNTDIDSTILQDTSAYIQSLFIRESELQIFHSFNHINDTAIVAMKLSSKSDLSEEQIEVLLLAVWFYFAGFPSNSKKYLDVSVELASSFLTKRDYSKEKIQSVVDLLLEIPTTESSLSSRLLHDTLLAYTASKDLFQKAELLRVEQEILRQKIYTDYDWEKLVYKKIIKSTFLTQIAAKTFQKRKLKNLRKQRLNVKAAQKVTTRKKTGKEFGRAIDTLYRANYSNHIKLSAIADGKANMMISINTIILSIIVTLSGAGFTMTGAYLIDHIWFTIPVFILLIGSLASVICSVISARPKITNYKVGMEDVEKNKSSLIFFGNFVQVPLNKFVDHLSELKKNQQNIYDSMSVDMYFLGVVLDKKYRLLSWSYNIFMISLIITVISFAIIFISANFLI